MKPEFFAAVLAMTCLSSNAARADVTVEMINDGDTALMFLGAEKMRMEQPSAGGPQQIILFNGTTMTLSILHAESSTYQKIDQNFLKDMQEGVGSMMDDMAKMMEKQMASLPPEQRKMIEEQMKKAKNGGMPLGMSGQSGAATPAAKETFESMKKSREINGWNCQGFKVMKNGRQIGETWTASLKEVGVSKSDLAVFAKLGDFGETMSDMDDSGDMDFNAFNPMSKNFIGIPILQIETKDGEKRVTEVTSIKKGKVSADMYEVPSGYTEKSLMEMPGMPTMTR